MTARDDKKVALPEPDVYKYQYWSSGPRVDWSRIKLDHTFSSPWSDGYVVGDPHFSFGKLESYAAARVAEATAELRDELTTCVEYLASRSQQIDSVELVLTGGGAGIPIVRDEVHDALQSSEAGAGYRFRQPPMSVAPALAIAAALSARAYAVRTPQGVAA